MREMIRKWLRETGTKGPWSLAYIYKHAIGKSDFNIKVRNSFIKMVQDCGIHQEGPDLWVGGGYRKCPDCSAKVRWALEYCFDCAGPGKKENPEWLR